jgi:hypothetical protein
MPPQHLHLTLWSPDMAGQFQCMMCNQSISYVALLMHVSGCYQQYIKPLCTCDGCEGWSAAPHLLD